MQIPILIAHILVLLSTVQAKCNNFTTISRANHDLTYSIPSSLVRVSAIEHCSMGTGGPMTNSTVPGTVGYCNSTQCPIYSDFPYYITLNRTINLTVSDSVTDSLFDLILGSSDTSRFSIFGNRANLNKTWAYRINGYGTCLEEGESGYIGFAPDYRCVDAVLSQCSGDGYPSDGTPLQACGVELLNTNWIVPSGSIGLVHTNAATAPAPANATLPPEESGTANTGLGWNVWLLQTALLLIVVTSSMVY